MDSILDKYADWNIKCIAYGRVHDGTYEFTLLEKEGVFVILNEFSGGWVCEALDKVISPSEPKLILDASNLEDCWRSSA